MRKDSTSAANKRIAKNTIALYVRMAFTMLVALYTSRVVLNALGVTDYGINSVVSGTVSFLSFLIFSMNTATQRFLNVAMGRNDEQEIQHIFSVSLTIHACILIIIVVVGEIVGMWLLYNKLIIPEERMVAAFWVFQFSMVSTATSVMTIPYNAVIIAYERMNIYAYFTILDTTLKLLIVYLLVLSPYDKLISYGFMYMCTFILNRIIYTIYCKRNFPNCRFSLHFPRKLFKEMLTFAGWDVFGVLAWACATQGVTILLNIFFGPTVNAARAIAGQVLGAIKGFSNNFMMALKPPITKAFGAGDFNYMFKLMYSGSKLVFILFFTIMCPLFIKTPYILKIWLKIVPDYTVVFIHILLVKTLILSMWSPLFISGLATGKIKYFGFVTSIMNILQIIVCYCFLKLGASPEYTVLAIGIWEVLAYSRQLMALKKLVGFSFWDYCQNVQFKSILVLIFTFSLSFLFSYRLEDNFINLLFIIIISSILSLSTSYFVLLNSNEKSFVKGRILKIFSK